MQRIEVKPGDQYGDMKVVREVESGGKRQFLCECDCGRQVMVRLGHPMIRSIVLCVVLFCVGCHSKGTTFDCSTDEAYSRSYESMMEELSPLEQERLQVAVLKLNMRAAEDVDLSSPDYQDAHLQRLNQLIDGKNAAEIIEMADDMRSE